MDWQVQSVVIVTELAAGFILFRFFIPFFRRIKTGRFDLYIGDRFKKDGSEMNVFPKGIKGENIFPKVMALSYGTENGRLRPRGFVQKGNNYIEGSEYEASIDRMIDRELAKYWS